MSDWEDFERDAEQARPVRCGVFLVLADLEEKAYESLVRALDNVRLTSSGIHKALSARLPDGQTPSASSIQRHRKGACGCPRRDRS